MRCRAVGYRTLVLLAAAVACCVVSSETRAQNIQAGVAVDAQGVLQVKTYTDPSGALTRQRIAAAKAALNPKVMAQSKLRMISLNRLEAALRENNGVPTDEMRNLAGLLRVHYVFYYPETKDIVLAGPAEGWMTDLSGRVVGLKSGRPVVQLQDLVVALRAFPPGSQGAQLIGCSIDPTPEGLSAMQRFLRAHGSTAVPAQTAQIVHGLQTSLGPQTVSINGVSPKTHFAQVLVEADYRMKLIGIGLEKPPVPLKSYVDRTNPAAVSRNALERWYFTPDYKCVRVADEGLAMELVGDGVKLVGEGEVVSAEGGRNHGQKSSKASQDFVAAFTKSYADLAARSPVYAELRNLIDLSIAAAYIQKADFYGKAGWNMPLLGSEKDFAVETYNSPKQVAAAINAIWKGHTLMTPIGGGVTINATVALRSDNQLADDGKLSKARSQIKLDLAKGQWWWD